MSIHGIGSVGLNGFQKCVVDVLLFGDIHSDIRALPDRCLGSYLFGKILKQIMKTRSAVMAFHEDTP